MNSPFHPHSRLLIDTKRSRTLYLNFSIKSKGKRDFYGSRKVLAFWFLLVGHFNTFFCDLGKITSSHWAWPKPAERNAQHIRASVNTHN